MDERSVIIADSDFAYRSTMASFFRKAGYRVEATDSTDQVLDSIKANEAPVLVLGSDFGNVASADLVHLLKKCNRRLQIILVSDGMTLTQTRQVCQEGIFYHALKPATAGEAEEIGQAVDCAFEKQAISQPDSAPAAHQQPAQKSARAQLMNALPWAAGIVALILGTNYLSLPAASGAHNGSSLAVWLFLAFCALIVTGQVLPIFRTKPLPGRVGHRQTARAIPPRGGR